MASSLKKKIKDLGIGTKKPKDFDPEDDPFSRGQDSESDDESSDENESGGREHYEAVGKSNLRKPKNLELDDKKYGGQVVSRSALNGDEDERDPFAPVSDDEDEDPFLAKGGSVSEQEDQDQAADVDSLAESDIDDEADEDDEIDSDEAFEEGEEEIFKSKGFVFRGSGKDTRQAIVDNDDEDMDDSNASGEDSTEGSEIDSDADMRDLDDESEDDGVSEDDDEDEDEDEDETSAKPRPKSMMSSSTTDREKLKSLISSDATAIATSLSQAASSDAKKGKAVRKQCQTFDRLLDARIKLQKGLTSANDLDLSSTSISDEEAQTALQKAEEAALRLYSTIESFRHSILETNQSTRRNSTSKKRKRPSPATPSTTTSTLWSQISDLESQSLPSRLSTLDKWSTKTRSTAPVPSSSKLNPSSNPQTNLSTILSTYLLSQTPNLILQSTIPTPTSSLSSLSSPPPSKSSLPPYSDTNFYQSLLRDLITSRSSTSSTTNTSAPLPLKLHASGNTRQKDTKASKGRKIRYTVHEKLANFMAGTGGAGPGQTQWSEAATREFFGSLMGGSGFLNEDEDEDEDVDVEDGEEEALRLFRS